MIANSVINIEQLNEEIRQALKQYGQEVVNVLENTAQRVGKKAVADLKENSPKATGSYRKSWRLKEQPAKVAGEPKSYVVHNKDRYQLTHLLEYGHVSRNGTSRVKAYPHIAKTEQMVIEDYYNMAKEGIDEIK